MNDFNKLKRMDQKAAEGSPSAEMHQALSLVRRVYPDAVVVGGAIRDHVLDRPIKDIDIFFPVASATWEEVHAALAAEYPDLIKESGGRYTPVVRSPNCGRETTMEIETIVLTAGQQLLFDRQKFEIAAEVGTIPMELVPVLVPTGEFHGWLEASQPVPLNGGRFDGQRIALPDQAKKDLDDRAISVIQSRLPTSAAPLRDITRRIEKLHQKLGWPVRLV